MADASNLRRGLQSATSDVKGLARELGEANKKGNLDHVVDSATGLGLGLLGAAGIAVKFAADFDKQMSAVSAATHAGAKEMDALRGAALQAGKDTQYSATEAAKGITELSKAGVSTADILGGGLKGSLALAAAGQIDVGEAAETAASAMTQFKLSGDKIPHVADLLAAGAGKAQGSVHDLGAALNQSGLIAASTGLSIEDTTGTLAAFASAGLIGSDAGTSFKTMLQALQAPSGKTKELMNELGISAYDAQGQFVGITALAGQLRSQLGKLTPELRANAMAQIFGSDATRAANILYTQGQAGIQGWIDKTNDAGYASETAAKLTDNLAGDLERLKGSLETMAIEGGSGANSGLRVITQGVGSLVDEFGKLPPAVGGTVVILAGLGGALALSLAAWIKLRGGIAKAVLELEAVGPAGARAATGLQAVSKAAGIVGVALVGLEVVGAVADQFGKAAVNVDKMTASLENYATTGKLSGGLTDEFGKNLDHFAQTAAQADAATHGFDKAINDLTSGIPGFGSLVDTLNEKISGNSFNHATEQMKGLDESLTAFMATQKDATKAGEIWNQLLSKSGLGTEQLAALLPGAWQGLQKLQATAHGAAGATGEAAKSTDDMGKAAEKAKADLDALNKAFKSLFDVQMSADRAAIKYQEGLTSLREELGKGTRTLDLNSAEGRKNRGAVLDQLSAIEDLREARLNEGQSLDVVNKKYKSDVEGLRRSMLQAGFSKKAVDELIGSYRAIPGKVGTNIQTPGLPQSSKAIKDYHKQLDALTRQIKTSVTVTGDAAAYKKLEKLLVAQQAAKKGISVSAAQAAFNKNAYRTGGWTGPGAEHDEAGVVHADEYVIKKSSRRKIEARSPGLLDEMNATGQVPGYAGGGMVMPFRVNAAGTQVPTMAQAMSVVGGAPGQFGKWPSSPGAQRGDSGVWRKIVALVRATGIPFEFGNGYRPGDPLWHGSGRAVDFMGFNQNRLADFFQARQGSVLELIHRTKSRDYGITRGHYNAMPHQWPLHRNHLHVAMADGGVINEPVFGVGASGTSYSFGERGIPETVIPGRPNYLAPSGAATGAGNTYVTVQLNANLAAGANPREHGRQIAEYLQTHLGGGGEIRVGGKVLLSRAAA
jgi:TP901 family phage tail tape measure protein